MAETLKQFRIPALTLLLILVAAVLYTFVIREEVEAACLGNPSAWMQTLINTLYPRFYIERNRFDAQFFLAKADMVFYRISLISLLFSFLPVIIRNAAAKEKLHRFLLTASSEKKFYIVSITLLIMHLLVVHEVYTSLLDRIHLAAFYKPRWINKLFSQEYPSALFIHTLSICWIISLLLFFIKKLRIVSGIISLAFFIWMQGYYFGFEKTDHSFYTFFLVCLLLPFYYYENKNEFVKNSWSLRWMQILVAMVYVFSALEKTSISGLQWLNPYNLQVHLLQHQVKAGLWIAQFDLLCSVLLLGAFLAQAFFLIGLFKRDWMKWACLGGIIFHMSTYFLMGIGHWINPWIIVYIVFIELNVKEKTGNLLIAGRN